LSELKGVIDGNATHQPVVTQIQVATTLTIVSDNTLFGLSEVTTHLHQQVSLF